MSETSTEIDGIPDAAQPLWTRLMDESLLPVHELFRQVHEYRQAIAQRSQWNDADVDQKLANALVEVSLRLLGTLGDDGPEERRRWVQAAIRYFVIEEDADGDLDSILGLDDDAEVINAVLRHLGHEGWTVEVP